MGILKVILLGCVRVTHNDWITEAKLPREIQALLAYLLIHRGRTHHREVLTEVFWGEQNHEKARRALNTALWRLKKVLEPKGIPSGTYLITTHSTEVGFNIKSHYWLDVEVFENETNKITTYKTLRAGESKIDYLEKIVELYRGELLEGFYDEWALRERERMRTIYEKSLMHLMQYYKFQREYDKAIAYGQQILNSDPLREDIHRELMMLYLERGQRAYAARQFAQCQLTLIRELGIAPMEETQLLYAQIFPETQKRHTLATSEDPLDVAQVLGHLQQVSQTIDLAKVQVEQAIYSIKRHSRPENYKSFIKKPRIKERPTK